ncbi:MAG: hypothetical protein SOU51_05175 [Collinsella sp.]|nr:hypothetical protein [Collinsella sp.]
MKGSLKKALAGLAFAIPTFFVFAVSAFADTGGMAPAPEGFMAFVVVIPLIVVIGLLVAKVDMLIAGLAGGILAMLFGGLTLADANTQLLETVPNMLSNTTPIINSAVATAVFKSGGYTAALMLVRRGIGKRTWIMAAFIVVLQSAATYMSGIGGGSAMVIAPLAFAALGAIPELVAAMSIATAACFTTSPASLESGVVSQLTGAEVGAYVSNMSMLTVLFVAISIGIAVYGTIRRQALFTGDEDPEFKDMTSADLWKHTVPAVFLLFAVIVGPFINKAVGMPVLGPLAYMVITVALIGVCTKFTFNESCNALLDGSSYILTRLLGVGIFLAFINLISATGAFTAIVNVAQMAPPFLLVPAMILAGFLIGFPAGAYVGSILALVLPIAISLGFSLFEVGLVTIGVGFGSQISYVNITMQALSSGFQLPIDKVVKGNLPWVGGALLLLLVIGFVF